MCLLQELTVQKGYLPTLILKILHITNLKTIKNPLPTGPFSKTDGCTK